MAKMKLFTLCGLVFALGLLGQSEAKIVKYCPTLQDLGCFEVDEEALKHMGQDQINCLPFSLETMDTVFYAYRKEDRHNGIFAHWNQTKSLYKFIHHKMRVVFLIHGFTDNYRKGSLVGIRRALLKYTKDVGTVVIVDWSKGSFHGQNIAPEKYQEAYAQAVCNLQLVARQVGNFANNLRVEHGMLHKHMYIIGHSLGAQTAGLAGKWIHKQYGWKLPRITGLDPAGPLFFNVKNVKFLKKGDADFVDIIHTSWVRSIEETNYGQLGYGYPTGDIDFYPNDGRYQPQCPRKQTDGKPSCNHQAAPVYFEESIRVQSCQFLGYKTKSMYDVLDAYGMYFPRNLTKLPKPILMGYYSDRYEHEPGRYYVLTGKKEPYCHIPVDFEP